MGERALLKYAMGFPSCIKTEPMPRPNASHSIMNSLVKSGKASTENDAKHFLSCSNAVVSPEKSLLLSKDCEGLGYLTIVTNEPAIVASETQKPANWLGGLWDWPFEHRMNL